MDVSAPIRAVIPSAHGPVLTVLARAGQPLTGRAIAELTRPSVSQKQVATILASLTEQGLVFVTGAGSAKLYTFNRDHLAAEAVVHLASLREQLWDRITTHVAGWTIAPTALVVYGSTARGDGDASSDIDILVVRPNGVGDSNPLWDTDVDLFVAALTRWTGNSVDLLDLSHGELTTMALAGEALLTHIRDDGRFLIGTRADVPAPLEA